MRRPKSYTAKVDEQGRFALSAGAASGLRLTAGFQIGKVTRLQAAGTRTYRAQFAEFEFLKRAFSRRNELSARHPEDPLSQDACEVLDRLA